jgi:mycothiol synthase
MSGTPKQQLQMLWPEHLLASLPEPVLPPGYGLRTFVPEDEPSYLNLMGLAGFPSGENAMPGYLSRALPHAFFLSIHLATGHIAATAMATHNPSSLHPFGGELGWVAGSPEHQGKRLGRAVCAAVTARFLAMGYQRIYLRTDDWRLPAIVTYLRLGYVPFLHAPDMPARWEAICAQIQWPFAPADWPAPATLDEEAVGQPPEPVRPDADTLDRYPRRFKWLPYRPHRGYALSGDVDAFGDESLYRPSQLGTASASPTQVRAGELAPLALAFTAGPAGLPTGTRITFVMRGQQPLGRPDTPYQIEGPAGCILEPAGHGPGFILRQGSLRAGQSVRLSAEPFRWTPLAGRREFKVVIDRADGSPQQRLPEPVTIGVLPGTLARLEPLLPCTHRPGEALLLQVTARDGGDNRVPWTGPLQVHPAGEPAASPRQGTETQDVHMVAGLARSYVRPDSGSTIRAYAVLDDTAAGHSLQAVSNPSVEAADLQLYVGDLHCHDFLSEAEGYPNEVYRSAIEDRKLDFVSVVPQAHGWLDNETWTIVKYVNERHLEERTFVTFLGFEWQHSGYGDKVIHYLGGDQPYLPVDDYRYNSPHKLYQELRASDALIIGHHPGYPLNQWVPGTDFDCVETDVERLVELWSMHGSSEGYDPADRPLVGAAPGGVMAALRKGVRLGFVAGSDTHSARPGGSAREPRPYWGGLAAIWAEELTRRALFQALHARHTYALTRARIVLKMTVNGALMGSELPAADRADVRIDAWTPGQIAQVEVLKNARLLRRFTPAGDECHIELEDRVAGSSFYHCRVTQTDGELAVCSPVWVG